MKTFEYNFQVLEHHLDFLGHVNNATYVALFEEARWDFITRNGYGVKEINEFGKSPVVLAIDIRYRKEITNREKIRIVSRPSGFDNKVMKIEQEMINEKGEVCCTGNFTVGFMDLKLRKLVTPNERWINCFRE